MREVFLQIYRIIDKSLENCLNISKIEQNKNKRVKNKYNINLQTCEMLQISID